MSKVFPLDSKVRFTQERLSILTSRDRQGLAGRIGVVQTDGNSVPKPTVYFPAEGAKPELRLFRVDPRHLELVEGLLSDESTTPFDSGENKDVPVDTSPPASGDSDKLSQGEMDNLFD